MLFLQGYVRSKICLDDEVTMLCDDRDYRLVVQSTETTVCGRHLVGQISRQCLGASECNPVLSKTPGLVCASFSCLTIDIGCVQGSASFMLLE